MRWRRWFRRPGTPSSRTRSIPPSCGGGCGQLDQPGLRLDGSRLDGGSRAWSGISARSQARSTGRDSGMSAAPPAGGLRLYTGCGPSPYERFRLRVIGIVITGTGLIRCSSAPSIFFLQFPLRCWYGRSSSSLRRPLNWWIRVPRSTFRNASVATQKSYGL
jgi:hypothetical protein